MANENIYQGGARGQTTAWATTNAQDVRQDPEIERQLRKIRPDRKPFTYLLDVAKQIVPSNQLEFTWQEQWPIEMQGVLTADSTAGDTTLNVNNDDYLRPGHLLYFPRTKESVLVVSLANDVATVQRGIGSTAVALVTGDNFLVTRSVAQEAQDAPQTLMRGTDSDTLYIEQIIHAAALSDWADMSVMRGPSEQIRLSEQAAEYFGDMRERAAMLGTPSKTTHTSTGMIVYTQAGLRWFCHEKGKVVSLANALTYDGLGRGVQHIGRNCKESVLYGFCGSEIHNKINSMREFRNAVQVSQDIREFGFQISSIRFPAAKRLELVLSEVMDEAGLDTEILVTAIGDLRRRRPRGSTGIELRRNIQTPGAFRKEWCYSVYEGLEHTNTRACGVIRDC